ncbi:bifunctional phosphopantothenoylcysteine decarboxylase/phosphopantothenate--cysteine ligase CoaBC [Ignatzschineria rhizosphaerae]|uniref:Coenzyme A biosynthesis bifunctional protein CoaBC n=1 Tax=Ignatzschineria rhizosphaerae TaxID=2923279 RepID=A0ABY3X0A0_9GAMM|nr:bifunctional phosphopantothenoylcysteine decarboxylase/phosphopantothenate--cysteine ligase CoaBC [Ignatzschineria rhizosphaerae]UNM95104.1 bifunctional phosphopantothenoylcysteine decarboxylase/phosphopantothenate--cysteine ligase CoaBC [Ignatzschineria rhizosphaerae]
MNILLGVSGSIAAYKSPDLVRRLKEVGFDVRVVMTDGGRSFVTPLTLQAVSGYPVVYDLLDPAHEAGMGHIELARWADLILIAPTSANMIAKLAGGFADDLLSAICLATEKPIMLAPGMNRLMWANQAVQENVAKLEARGMILLAPESGSQACGEIGQGRMPEPLQIRDAVEAFFQALQKDHQDDQLLLGKKIVITAGPTVEEIDPVRYISNYSSGKMGYSLAIAAQKMGAIVTLISGPVALDAPKNMALVKVKSAREMMDATFEATRDADVFIAAAAVADYAVANRSDEKLKKTDDSDLLTLTFKKNPDILATIAKGEGRPAICVGFAAETHDIEANALSKLQRKNVDMICLNDVSGGKVFGESDNEMILFKRSGEPKPILRADKLVVAEKILAEIIPLLPKMDIC